MRLAVELELGAGRDDDDVDMSQELALGFVAGTRVAGERFGPARRFEILGLLGAGGAGEVYLSFDHALGRRVAVKFMREMEGRSSELDARAEACATARLNHDNIVTVYDIGFECGPYIVMEYLEGEPLNDLIGHASLSAPRAIAIMIDVTAGLAHAHAAGLLHLDLKPSNILVERSGRAKILDFGVGSNAAFQDVEPAPLVGTPMYMAPEQWGGSKPDGRTDIWAAGMVLYELLSGQSPDPGSAPSFRLQMPGRLAVPGIGHHLGLPPSVDTLLTRALAPDRSARFQSACELKRALERVLAELSLGPGNSYSTR